MAARLNRMHTADVLKKIQVSRLITLLQDDAFGKLKHGVGEGKEAQSYELSAGRSANARFLIERILAKAEAPKDLNLHFEGHLEVEFV